MKIQLSCLLVGLAASTQLAGCAISIDNRPLNSPLRVTSSTARNHIVREEAIALSFSGGGLRASAFAFGVLEELRSLRGHAGSGYDDVVFISAVSGGALTAGYFGVHGEAAFATFRETVLLADGEAALRTNPWSPENWVRILRGGLNDRDNLVRWLEKDVFEGATMAAFSNSDRPEIWINATDLFNGTPFPFTQEVFSTFCSDLATLPVSEAVAASMAVPLLFAPITLQSFPEACREPEAAWIAETIDDPAAPSLLRATARAARNYRDPERMRFLKLADGGVTDNLGLSSILIARGASRTPVGPLSPEQAVRLQRLRFFIVEAGAAPLGNWAQRQSGPGALALARSATDAAIGQTMRIGADAFRAMAADWRDSIVDYRCSLSREDAARLGAPSGWSCDALTMEVVLVSPELLDAELERAVNQVPLRLTLPEQNIDDLIAGGRIAMRRALAASEGSGSAMSK